MALTRDKTAQDIASIFGVHVKVARRWAREGCPHARRKDGYRFDEAEVAHWLKENHRTTKPGRPPEVGRSPSLEEAKLRKENLLCEKYEEELKRIRGEVISREEVERQNVAKVTAVRNRLMGLGAILAARLDGLTVADRQGVIDGSMREVCEGFARP